MKSLVELHNGEITVQSEPGRGSTFQVRLPAALPSAESGRSLAAIRGCRVLVVDDEPEIAGLIAGQLAPLVVQVTVALSGHEALERLRAEHFDAVTLDVLMPDRDGFEVLRAIRADPELRGTPIVFGALGSRRAGRGVDRAKADRRGRAPGRTRRRCTCEPLTCGRRTGGNGRNGGAARQRGA